MNNTATIYKCKICNDNFNSKRGLSIHIRKTHNINLKEYYDKYLKKENDGVCKDCNNPTVFISIYDGYKEYCHNCAIKHGYEKLKQICLNRSDVENEIIYQKKKQTWLKNFGVENPSQSSIIKEKKKQTTFEHYGVENPMHSEIVQQKYNDVIKKTYGVNWILQCNTTRKKGEQAIFKKYGVKNASQSNEIKTKKKQTTLKHFGVETSFQSNECKEKSKQTWLNKYGVENPSQSNEIKNKKIETSQKHFGVEYPMQSYIVQNKIYETKKKNGTFNTSTVEELFKQYLTENNYQFESQYKSDMYPFNCDFYLLKYDLYIEINASWTHGNHPYNENDENDIQLLNEWILKSKDSDYYNNAIEVWTKRDVKKQQIAKQNNLNYLVMYSNNINEVIKQFNNYIYNI